MSTTSDLEMEYPERAERLGDFLAAMTVTYADQVEPTITEDDVCRAAAGLLAGQAVTHHMNRGEMPTVEDALRRATLATALIPDLIENVISHGMPGEPSYSAPNINPDGEPFDLIAVTSERNLRELGDLIERFEDDDGLIAACTLAAVLDSLINSIGLVSRKTDLSPAIRLVALNSVTCAVLGEWGIPGEQAEAVPIITRALASGSKVNLDLLRKAVDD